MRWVMMKDGVCFHLPSRPILTCRWSVTARSVHSELTPHLPRTPSSPSPVATRVLVDPSSTKDSEGSRGCLFQTMSTSSPTDTTTATTTTTTTLDTATAGRPLSPTPSFAATGFVTSHLCSPHALPIVLRAIPSVVCLLLGLCLTFLSVYAGRWGTRLGKQRGDGSSAGWLGGGVRGVWVGALVMREWGREKCGLRRHGPARSI